MPKRHYRKRTMGTINIGLPIALILLTVFICPTSMCIFSSLVEDKYKIPLYIFMSFIGIGAISLAVILFFLIMRYKKERVLALQAATDYKSIASVIDLRPRELEELAAKVYSRLGYRNVKLTGGAFDGGVDVWMLGMQGVEVVQCKQLSKRVDKQALINFSRTMRQHQAEWGHYWAPHEFTQPAIDYAKDHKIRLYEEHEIMNLVRKAFIEVPKPN